MRRSLSRLAALFVEPSGDASRAPAPARSVFLPPSGGTGGETAPSGASPPSVASRAAPHRVAAVLGAPAAVVPVAAACAGELRARAGAPAALLCVWRPAVPAAAVEPPEPPEPPEQSPAGATTPGGRRLAGRLAAHGLPATACGRLAWLALDPDPACAATAMGRCFAIADVPVVLAIAGPRPRAFEPLLADLDLAIAVLPPGVDPALRELAVATLRARGRAVVAPLAPGPPRWSAMAGLARLRSLPREEP